MRQRKDRFGGVRYSIVIMNESFEISEASVEDILISIPRAARLFLNWRTGCVGCGFARFCTWKDVVKTYQLDGQKALEELKQANVQNP